MKFEMDAIETEFPVKNKRKALKRYKSITKALRKRHISKNINHMDWYNNLHEYSKNKIHCSCGMCRFRSAWNPDNKPMQDIRNIQAMNCKYDEYIKSA